MVRVAQDKAPVVLVTGCATGGIGAALAAEFLAKGCTVYASDIKLDNMAGLPDGIRKQALDVTQLASIKAAVEQVIKEQGHIDVLVNNAGVGGSYVPLVDTDLQAAKTVFDVNVYGMLAVTQAVVPYMASRRQGKIVNMGSVLGMVSYINAGVYCATKFAVRSMTDTLRLELKPFNIKVMLVAPGMIETPLWGKTIGNAKEMVKTYKVFAEQGPTAIKVAEAFLKEDKTPVDYLARKVVQQTLRRDLKRHFILGAMSGTFKLLDTLPKWLADRLIADKCMWTKPLKPLQL